MSLTVDVRGLTFRHGSTVALADLSLNLNKGDRCVLVGANGAGKSTLLQILAGKRLLTEGSVQIFGQDVFRQTPEGVTFLGTEWASNPHVRSDIVVSAFLDSVGGYRHKERRDKLLSLLDIDLDWHMHQISDGERRRVQLCFGLMAPWDVLLLDEVTVDLDVLVRSELLEFLKEESETRGATILYATHIFDLGMSEWPTHVVHMREGKQIGQPVAWTPDQPLHGVALQWLKEDRELRRAEEANGVRRKTRGARVETVPSDSETFYRRYDYSH